MNQNDTSINQSAIKGLAVIGFISLVVAGMWLAVYSTRFVPTIVNRVGATAVYLGTIAGRVGAATVFLGSVFNRAPNPGISTIPASVASTTIFFGNVATTSSPSIPVVTPAPTIPTKTVAGTETDNVYQIGGATSSPSLYGLPDLVVQINAVGYLATTSANSFIATSTVPAGSRPAVSFTIKNIGTNVAGPWRFSASIPTQTAYIYQSQLQQSLNPGDSIDYTLGFDQANKGANKTISITANFDHAVGESNTNNNSASATVTILGS